MEKRYLSPLEILNLGTQHAYAADQLLDILRQEIQETKFALNVLSPITSLMYQAFQLTLKAYSLHDHRPLKEYKKLMELVDLNMNLGFSQQEIILLKTLARHQTFHKGTVYELWDDQQHLHVFCENLLSFYRRLLEMMPLELQPDYQE